LAWFNYIQQYISGDHKMKKHIISIIIMASASAYLSCSAFAITTVEVNLRATSYSKSEACSDISDQADADADRVRDYRTTATAMGISLCSCDKIRNDDEIKYKCSQKFKIVSSTKYSPPPPVRQRSWLAEHPEAIYQPMGQ